MDSMYGGTNLFDLRFAGGGLLFADSRHELMELIDSLVLQVGPTEV